MSGLKSEVVRNGGNRAPKNRQHIALNDAVLRTEIDRRRVFTPQQIINGKSPRAMR